VLPLAINKFLVMEYRLPKKQIQNLLKKYRKIEGRRNADRIRVVIADIGIFGAGVIFWNFPQKAVESPCNLYFGVYYLIL
jgi:hypothetical protein